MLQFVWHYKRRLIKSISLLCLSLVLICSGASAAGTEQIISLPLIYPHKTPDELPTLSQIYEAIFTPIAHTDLTREELLTRLKIYITTAMAITRHSNLEIEYWDVVTDALKWDETGWHIGVSPWLELLGPDYLAQAFLIAHDADPEANLHYADYLTADPQKNAAIYTLVKSLIDQQVPITGLTMLFAEDQPLPDEKEIAANLQLYASLDMQISLAGLPVEQFVRYYSILTQYTDKLTAITLKDPYGNEYVVPGTIFSNFPQNLAEPLTLTTVNLLIHRPITASHLPERSARAIDGQLSTSWAPRATPPYWLTVDLGDVYILTRWVVYHRGSGGIAARTELINGAINTCDFKLQVSLDQKEWMDVDVVTDNTSAVTDRWLPPTAARYVRLFVTKPSSLEFNQDLVIYDWEIYGVAGR